MTKPLTSPTGRLLIGLAVTLAAVAVFSLYALQQIDGLKDLQTRTVDRNRKDSLQLLRIQNDLNSLGLAMRDMVDNTEPYPLDAWKGQWDRTRTDLEDALRMEAHLAPAARDPQQQQYLADSVSQFWTTTDRVFQLAGQNPVTARDLIRTSLQAQQGALASAVARLLVENNETEQQAMARIQDIYQRVERNIYYFVIAMLLAISLTSLYLIRSNLRLFKRLAMLSNQKSDLARKLITVQEEALRSISRELHDEFGQILTAIGAMLRRAEKQGLAPDSPFRSELQEVREVAQGTLEKVRSLSQALHPAILDDGGLEKAVDWYLPVFEKQTGITVRYQKEGTRVVPDRIAVNVYRVLQEALNNLARHSGSNTAWVRMGLAAGQLSLEVEDHGAGMPGEGKRRNGIGMVAMRERAELLHGQIDFLRPAEGGTLVRLSVPLAEPDSNEN